MNTSLRVLFVSDPNLGSQGSALARRYFRNVRTLIWQRNDGPGKSWVAQAIESDRWDLLISFYNDFIFTEKQLAQATIALNIHPALPEIRGLGYDILPLVYGHQKYGATLHTMNTQIDAGEIIRVSSVKLSDDMTYGALRPATQNMCLAMLMWLCRHLSTCSTIAGARECLEKESRRHDQEWGPTYTNRSSLHEILMKLRRDDPLHAAFR